jgi:UDPglucose 6-dehydrogenase
MKKKVGPIRGKTVSVLGLAFKPDTDDVRDSVSIKLIELLLKNGVNVIAHDPKAIENTRAIFGSKIRYTNSINDALRESYCVIIMTAWKQYAGLGDNNFKFMKQRIIVDSRRMLVKKNLDADYYALGIGNN